MRTIIFATLALAGAICPAQALDAGDVVRFLEASCPGINVSMGKVDDRNTWQIEYPPTATAGERNACNAKIVNFDAASDAAVYLPPRTLLGRFTDAEYGALLQASNSSIRLARWLDEARGAQHIDLAAPATKQARAAMIAAGVLNPARADAVFGR